MPYQINPSAFDHYKAGYIAGQYLVENGHKDIAYISGWFDTTDANERHQWFIRCA